MGFIAKFGVGTDKAVHADYSDKSFQGNCEYPSDVARVAPITVDLKTISKCPKSRVSESSQVLSAMFFSLKFVRVILRRMYGE